MRRNPVLPILVCGLLLVAPSIGVAAARGPTKVTVVVLGHGIASVRWQNANAKHHARVHLPWHASIPLVGRVDLHAKQHSSSGPIRITCEIKQGGEILERIWGQGSTDAFCETWWGSG